MHLATYRKAKDGPIPINLSFFFFNYFLGLTWYMVELQGYAQLYAKRKMWSQDNLRLQYTKHVLSPSKPSLGLYLPDSSSFSFLSLLLPLHCIIIMKSRVETVDSGCIAQRSCISQQGLHLPTQWYSLGGVTASTVVELIHIQKQCNWKCFVVPMITITELQGSNSRANMLHLARANTGFLHPQPYTCTAVF